MSWRRRAVSQTQHPSSELLAPCLHRLIAIADPWRWPCAATCGGRDPRLATGATVDAFEAAQSSRGDPEMLEARRSRDGEAAAAAPHTRSNLRYSGQGASSTSDGSRHGAASVALADPGVADLPANVACAVEVLLALKHIASRHPWHVADALPLMVNSQHGFAWPPLDGICKAVRLTTDQVAGCISDGAARAGAKISLAGKIPDAFSEDYDLLTAWQLPPAYHDAYSVVKPEDLLTDRSTSFAALAMLVLLANAAQAEDGDAAIWSALPAAWKAVYDRVRLCTHIGGWCVTNVLPQVLS